MSLPPQLHVTDLKRMDFNIRIALPSSSKLARARGYSGSQSSVLGTQSESTRFLKNLGEKREYPPREKVCIVGYI